MLRVTQGSSTCHFKVFRVTQPGLEPPTFPTQRRYSNHNTTKSGSWLTLLFAIWIQPSLRVIKKLIMLMICKIRWNLFIVSAFYALADEVTRGSMFLGCPYVRKHYTWVRLSMLLFCFFCNRLSHWHKFFIIHATTDVECFNDNFDVISHVVWQPCWKKGKTLDLCVSETAPWKKLKLATC